MPDLEKANKYFESRLNTDAWDSVEDDTIRRKALSTARRQLEPYRQGVSVSRFAYAVYEQALWLLQGDTRSELRKAGVQSYSIGDISETFSTNNSPSQTPANISPDAWAFLKVYGIKTGRLV